MKKIFAFTLSLVLLGCDDNPVRTEPNVANNQTKVVTNVSKKTIILSKNAVYDTIRTTVKNNTITGSLISNGSNSIVCSEQMNRCAKTNSKGVYQIVLPIQEKVAGRIYEGVDTITTPENVDVSSGDTTVTPIGNDTSIVSDTLIDTTMTISGNDTLIVIEVEQIDTIYSADSILVEISEPSPVDTVDTLSVVSDGTILREIPINSWGHILDSGFIDKWSIEVYDTSSDHSITNVEFVYFSTGDSIAQVVTLGRAIVGGEYTNRFSGPFFYYWDDSAYSKDKFIHNYFVRGKDSFGNVITKTDIETFSAKAIPAKIVQIGKKLAVPQHAIKPKFIPSAKNNKKLKESVLEYLNEEDKTINWINLNNIPFSYVEFISIDSVGSVGLTFNNITQIDFNSLGIGSVSFDIETTSDSVYLGIASKKLVVPNRNQTIHFNLPDIVDIFCIVANSKKFTIPAKVTNVRFYFKDGFFDNQ